MDPVRLHPGPWPYAGLWVPLADVGGPDFLEDRGFRGVARLGGDPLPASDGLGLAFLSTLRAALVDPSSGDALFEMTFDDADNAWDETVFRAQALVVLAGPSFDAEDRDGSVQRSWAAVVRLTLFVFMERVGPAWP